jgi:tight adherence protein C
MIPVLVGCVVAVALAPIFSRQPIRRFADLRAQAVGDKADRDAQSSAGEGPGRQVRAAVDRSLRRTTGNLGAPRRWPAIMLIASIAGVAGPLTGAAAVVAVFVIGRVRQWRVVRHAAAELERATPEVFDLLSTLLRSGLTPALACAELASAAPRITRSVFHELDARRRSGERFADALEHVGRTHPTLRPLADTLARAERYGDPIGPIIDRLADEARQRRRRSAETSARQLPVRLCFPLVCCTLPAFVLLTIVPLLAGALTSLRQSI